MKRKKNEHCVFLAGLRLHLSRFHRGNTAFTVKSEFPGSQTHVLLQFQNCVKTNLGHTVPFHEKKVGRECSVTVVCPAVVTQIRWNCILRWLPSKKWQTGSFFQKGRTLEQSSCCNGKKSEPVCFSGRLKVALSSRWLPSGKQQVVNFFEKTQILDKAFVVMKRKMNQCVFLASLRLKLSRFYRGKILLLQSGPNFRVHKNMLPCSFRAV